MKINNMSNPLSNILSKNKVILLILTVVIIIYYVLFSSFSEGQTLGSGEGSGGLNILELLLWGILVFLILVNGLQYFFNIDIKASIRNLLSDEPEIDLTVLQDKLDEEKEEELPGEEVFHVKDNKYTYEESKAVCKAFGSRLATYNEVEEAYEKGGEWCGYGWTADQLALYPTQQGTYDELQKKKGYEHSCGRPGVNGGYIGNPNVRFGVNCYGYKPKMTEAEMTSMEKIGSTPLTKEEIEFENKVNKYRNNIEKILLNPFNNNRWSQVN